MVMGTKEVEGVMYAVIMWVNKKTMAMVSMDELKLTDKELKKWSKLES
jgi:hypothetical protein